MFSRPPYGIRVADLAQSIRFYRVRLGLPVDADTGITEAAVLGTHPGQRFLLAGPGAPDWTADSGDGFTVLSSKDTLYMNDPEFERRLELMREAGIEFELIERPWGERMIEVVDPDGYRLSLRAMRERTRAEIVDLFETGRDGLRRSIRGMSDLELAWRPGPDEWSAREVIHHVVDSEITVLHAMRVALASPGCEYHANPYDQDHFARELQYQHRDIEPALRMFEAMRELMLDMIEAIPDGWGRTVRTRRGETTVETFIEMLALHAMEHIEQIVDIRNALEQRPADR